MTLNHIAIIVSSEGGIEFYKKLGFVEISRQVRPDKHDEIIFLEGNGCTLEIFKDATHPKHITNPEALGLRHLCFETDEFDNFTFDEMIRINPRGKRFCFLKDPDGLPVEIVER